MKIQTTALFAGLLAGCSASVVDGDPSTAELVIDVAEASRLEATITVGEETVLVDSRTEDGMRTLSVSSADGTSYALWQVNVVDHETAGTFGEQPFGYVETADSDGDTEVWKPIARSRVGTVLAAVSAAAARLAGAEGLEAVNADLENLSFMSSHLERLAGASENAASASCSNSRQIYGYVNSYSNYSHTCLIYWQAFTYRCGGTSLWAYVRIYNTSGTSVAYDSDQSSGVIATAIANHTHGNVPHNGNSTRRAKHWDNKGFSVWSSWVKVPCPSTATYHSP